jgi:PEP-CTERM motif
VSYSQLIPCRASVLLLAITATAIVLSGGSARAELIFSNVYTGTNFDIQASNPVSLAGTSLEAVTLRAVGKNGAQPDTFDSDKSGRHGTGITTAVDALNQIWFANVVPTPTLTNVVAYLSPTDQTLDTHFLVYDNNLTIPRGLSPSEDRDGNVGTYLKGTFTDDTAVSSTWDFAYLVVPNGTTVNLDFEIGAPNFSSETVSGSFTVVPEPSALLLLAMGVLGLLACRRRLGR